MFTTPVIILLCVALAGGGVGGWALKSQMTKAQVAESVSQAQIADAKARELEAAAQATKEAGNLVEAAVSEHLAKTEMAADLLSLQRASYLCDDESPLASELGCTVFLFCAQAKAGTVPVAACDAAVNQWLSERQLLVIEADDADEKLRDERRHMFEKRK